MRGIDVNARAFKAIIERQRLVDLAGYVQPDVPVDAAVVGVEIVRIPFKRDACGAFRVGSLVVDLDREYVLLGPEVRRIGDVEAVRRDSVFTQPDLLAVKEDVARLAHALEFEEDLVAGQIGGQPEVFAVPRESLIGAAVATAVGDELPERVDVVERVRRADRLPF